MLAVKNAFDYAIVIGRFQPIHEAHTQLIKIALQQAANVIVVVGSYKRAPSPRNAWTGEEREGMIRGVFSPEENKKIKIILLRDYLYNDNYWLADITQKIFDATNGSKNILLVGHNHDHSSYYLNMFPQWKSLLVKDMEKYPHATKIRELYFTHDNNYKRSLHPNTITYLEEFKKTEKFHLLKEYFDHIVKTKNEWMGSPFPITFNTVDAVVVKSGHILCVRRGKALGKKQIALPGGFLNPYETLRDAAIRELKEETVISLSKDYLDKSIVAEKTFDYPDRSERGRTISQAFLFDLGTMGELPVVRGSDDAAKAWWMPIREFYTREEEFFEDHYFIIQYFLGKF